MSISTKNNKENEKYLKYESPLVSRYASPEMLYNFSDFKKFSNWRKLWFNLIDLSLSLFSPNLIVISIFIFCRSI